MHCCYAEIDEYEIKLITIPKMVHFIYYLLHFILNFLLLVGSNDHVA